MQSSVAFPVTYLPMQSAAVPLSLLAKGIFCTSLPFILCEFYEVVPFFSFMCWFWENFLSFFTSAVSVLGIIYNLKAVTQRMILKIYVLV